VGTAAGDSSQTLVISVDKSTTAIISTLHSSQNTNQTTATLQGGSGPTPKSNIGPIVGGAVGGIAALAIIIFFVWFFLRRRKRKQAEAKPGLTYDEKCPVDNADVPGYHGIPELPHNTMYQELDPAKGTTAIMKANELEMGSESEGGTKIRTVPVPVPQLADGAHGHGHDVAASRQEFGGDRQQHEEYEAQQQQQDLSPYVEAQRRLEMDWLESEEARLRARRDLLRQQQQGG
jgi:hypothetical protein